MTTNTIPRREFTKDFKNATAANPNASRKIRQ
jgi:hypothetical protein